MKHSTVQSRDVYLSNWRLEIILILSGILSSVVYIVTDLIASWWDTDYSILDQNYSELLATGAPTRPGMLVATVIYNLLVISFAIGIWIRGSSGRTAQLTAGMLFMYAITGFLGGAIFQMDQRGAEATTRGSLHPIMTMIMSLFLLLAMIFAASLYGRNFRIYTYVTVAVLITFGIITSLQVPQLADGKATPWMGLTERVNIYATMLWIAILSIMMLRTTHKLGASSPQSA